MNLPHLDGAGYDEVINEGKESCIIVFSKESCQVCSKLSPIMEKVAKEYEMDPTLNFYTMDVLQEDARAIFKSLKLVGVPQSVFFNKGVEHIALPGAIDENIIRTEIHEMFNPKKSFGDKIKGLFGRK